MKISWQRKDQVARTLIMYQHYANTVYDLIKV